MRALAIIPARGGSKRIPRKNIKEFLGKPIISYSINNARRSGLFEQVMVSTDDQEIANCAEKFGATVPFLRSAKNSNDFATTVDVINEVLDSYDAIHLSFDYACCIYPTAPLLSINRLKEAFDLLKSKSFSSVFPVVEFGYPIWRSLKVDVPSGVAEMNWPQHIFARSQDLPKAYHDAGQFYWINVSEFRKDPRLFGDRSGVVILSELEVQDIDTETDWKLAELKAGLLK